MNLFYPLSDITPNIPNIPNKIKNIINPTNIDKITEADVVKDNLVENENKKHFSLRKTYKDMIISNFSNYSQYFTTENVLYGLVAVTFIAGSSYCWFNGINPIDFIPDSVKNIFGYLFAPGIIIDKVCETSAVVYNYTLGPVWDGISNLWSYARGTRGATANPDVVNALNKGKEVIKLALQGSIFESNWFAFNDVFSGAVHIIPQSLFQFYKDNLYFELTPFPMEAFDDLNTLYTFIKENLDDLTAENDPINADRIRFFTKFKEFLDGKMAHYYASINPNAWGYVNPELISNIGASTSNLGDALSVISSGSEAASTVVPRPFSSTVNISPDIEAVWDTDSPINRTRTVQIDNIQYPNSPDAPASPLNKNALSLHIPLPDSPVIAPTATESLSPLIDPHIKPIPSPLTIGFNSTTPINTSPFALNLTESPFLKFTTSLNSTTPIDTSPFKYNHSDSPLVKAIRELNPSTGQFFFPEVKPMPKPSMGETINSSIHASQATDFYRRK